MPRGEKLMKEDARQIHRSQGQPARHSTGSPVSPLLANIYMRRFVLGWKKLGLNKALARGL